MTARGILSQKKAPRVKGDTTIQKAFDKIYTEINLLTNSVNSAGHSEVRDKTSGKPGDIRAFKDKTDGKYYIEAKFEEGWAKRQLGFMREDETDDFDTIIWRDIISEQVFNITSDYLTAVSMTVTEQFTYQGESNDSDFNVPYVTNHLEMRTIPADGVAQSLAHNIKNMAYQSKNNVDINGGTIDDVVGRFTNLSTDDASVAYGIVFASNTNDNLSNSAQFTFTPGTTDELGLTGNFTMTGNLQVTGDANITGTTTELNTATLQILDTQIDIGYTDGTSELDSNAHQGGWILHGGQNSGVDNPVDKTILWHDATVDSTYSSDRWELNQDIAIEKEDDDVKKDKQTLYLDYNGASGTKVFHDATYDVDGTPTDVIGIQTDDNPRLLIDMLAGGTYLSNIDGAPTSTEIDFSIPLTVMSDKLEKIRIKESNSVYADIELSNEGNMGISMTGTGLYLDNYKQLGSSTFTSGFDGTGWRIEHDSNIGADATFDNLTVRGTLQVYELLINQIRATNGSVLVSSAARVESIGNAKILTALTSFNCTHADHTGLPEVLTMASVEDSDVSLTVYVSYDSGGNVYSVNVTDSVGDCRGKTFILVPTVGTTHDALAGVSTWDATFEDPSDHGVCPFVDDDLVYAQTVQLDSSTLVKQTVRIVTDVSGIHVNWSNPGYGYTDTGGGESVGETYVRLGSTSDADRTGTVYITSDDDNAPYISVNDNVGYWFTNYGDYDLNDDNGLETYEVGGTQLTSIKTQWNHGLTTGDYVIIEYPDGSEQDGWKGWIKPVTVNNATLFTVVDESPADSALFNDVSPHNDWKLRNTNNAENFIGQGYAWKDARKTKVRLGDLSGITDVLAGLPLEGNPQHYGLYSDNVYLRGRIQAQSGYIGTQDKGWMINDGMISNNNFELDSEAQQLRLGTVDSFENVETIKNAFGSGNENKGIILGLAGAGYYDFFCGDSASYIHYDSSAEKVTIQGIFQTLSGATVDVMSWQGAFSPGSPGYFVDDAVSYGGSSWICILNTEDPWTDVPVEGDNWNLLASVGDTIPGVVWHSGDEDPDSGTPEMQDLGNIGDFYLWTTNESVHEKETDTTWSAALIDMSATDGTSGDQINWIFAEKATQPNTPPPSAGVPPEDDCVWYDTYEEVELNAQGVDPVWTTSGTQTAGAGNFTWDSPARLTGQDGEQGEQGEQGDDGPPGDDGLPGDQGPQGEPGIGLDFDWIGDSFDTDLLNQDVDPGSIVSDRLIGLTSGWDSGASEAAAFNSMSVAMLEDGSGNGAFFLKKKDTAYSGTPALGFSSSTGELTISQPSGGGTTTINGDCINAGSITSNAEAGSSGLPVTLMDIDDGKFEVRDSSGTLRVVLGQLA